MQWTQLNVERLSNSNISILQRLLVVIEPEVGSCLNVEAMKESDQQRSQFQICDISPSATLLSGGEREVNVTIEH